MSNELQFQEVNPEFTGYLRRLEEINQKCEDNMKRLNQMMLELKALVAMVRPQVKKTGWYGDEIKAQVMGSLMEISHSQKENDLILKQQNHML